MPSDGCQSGRMGRPAKALPPMGVEGSNPSPSVPRCGYVSPIDGEPCVLPPHDDGVHEIDADDPWLAERDRL
jgi:hypothetical protein